MIRCFERAGAQSQKKLSAHCAFDTQLDLQGDVLTKCAFSNKIATECSKSINNTTLASAIRHPVRFSRHPETKHSSQHCYLPRTTSGYLKLKSLCYLKLPPAVMRGQRTVSSLSYSAIQQLCLDSTAGSSPQDHQSRNKMNSNRLMRTTVEPE